MFSMLRDVSNCKLGTRYLVHLWSVSDNVQRLRVRYYLLYGVVFQQRDSMNNSSEEQRTFCHSYYQPLRTLNVVDSDRISRMELEQHPVGLSTHDTNSGYFENWWTSNHFVLWTQESVRISKSDQLSAAPMIHGQAAELGQPSHSSDSRWKFRKQLWKPDPVNTVAISIRRLLSREKKNVVLVNLAMLVLLASYSFVVSFRSWSV